MAKDDQGFEIDVDDSDAPGGVSKKSIIISIAAAILIGVGVAVFLMLGGESCVPEEAKECDEVASDKKKGPAQYIGVPQPIIANIPGKKRNRTVQIRMTFMVRSDEARGAVQSHIPQLKNDVLMLVSQQSADEIKTPEGRKKLQAQSLEIVRERLEELVGEPMVEKVLFTSFVMQ